MGVVLNLSEPALDMFLYGDKSSFLSNYLTKQLQNIAPAFNSFSQRIYENIQSSFNFINDKLTQYGILGQLNNAGIQVNNNYIMEINSFKGLQEANITMQRWIMSHPQVRELYIKQNIDGYSNTYKNIFGKDIGENDYNYRLITDSVLKDIEDGYVIKYYIDDLLPGDKELDHYEKVKILNTFDTINWILDTCKFDFTINSDCPPIINRE